MAKSIPDAIIDLMLAEAEGTQIHVCSAEPANYAGIAAVELADAAISGSYTKANGDTSGRKNTLPAQTGISIASSGTATHVAISNNTDTMYLVTTCTSQALTSGGTVDTNAFDHEIGDAS
ncbi:MAG: hypothetical protein ACPGSM_09590 [Thiolinea sp.]